MARQGKKPSVRTITSWEVLRRRKQFLSVVPSIMGVSAWLNRGLLTACSGREQDSFSNKADLPPFELQGRPATIWTGQTCRTFPVHNVSPYENQNQTSRNDLSFKSYHDASAGLCFKIKQEIFSCRLQKAELLFRQTIYFLSLFFSPSFSLSLSPSYSVHVTLPLTPNTQSHVRLPKYTSETNFLLDSTTELPSQAPFPPKKLHTAESTVNCSYRHSPTHRNTVLLGGSTYRLQYTDS
jgi:hypothetical protein